MHPRKLVPLEQQRGPRQQSTAWLLAALPAPRCVSRAMQTLQNEYHPQRRETTGFAVVVLDHIRKKKEERRYTIQRTSIIKQYGSHAAAAFVQSRACRLRCAPHEMLTRVLSHAHCTKTYAMAMPESSKETLPFGNFLVAISKFTWPSVSDQ